MLELLDQIQFLHDYGNFSKEHDIKSGLWDFLHRLSELDDYIKTVEAIRECLNSYDIKSEGLLQLKEYMNAVYETSFFAELKEDISNLKADTSSLKSITLGINLNRSFEVESIGLISVNNKEFKSSGILSNFADALTSKNGIHDGNEWNGSYRFHPFSNRSMQFSENAESFGKFYGLMQQPLIGAAMAATVANVPDHDSSAYLTKYFDQEISHLLSHLTKKLEQMLAKYVSLSIHDIVELIPEFTYYVRWAKFIERLQRNGFQFCTAQILDPSYALAQGGISVPGDEFSFVPADCIYTHYPADEDKTLDLGRLGEECRRFKEIFNDCTESSLLLMNETFSTTSFEEGYYIAKDAVKAIISKNVRTIYNTHMHKLAFEIKEFNEFAGTDKITSLVAESEEGKRSFKIHIAPPEGKSYAEDIAEKYGVTYEALISNVPAED